jgi:transcriptional regulator with XRE-family HTH domain
VFVNELLRLHRVVSKSQTGDRASKAIGANLRRIRDRRGLTQEKLAELADVHYRTIQKIESGEMLMRLPTLFRLRAALECRWVELLGSE